MKSIEEIDCLNILNKQDELKKWSMEYLTPADWDIIRNAAVASMIEYAQQFASQPPAPVGNVFPDAAEFEDYIGDARDAFVNDVNNQDWNTKMRTASESILICFDQMADRIKQFNKHPVGKMWEDSCPFCEISPVMCKSCGETLPSPVTSLQGGYSLDDMLDWAEKNDWVWNKRMWHKDGWRSRTSTDLEQLFIQSLNKK